MTTSSQFGPRVDRFLSSDYNPTGTLLRLKDDTEFYCAGSDSKNGLIIIPDTMGWNAGRVRNIADFFGENKCLTAIPKIMGSSKEAEAGPPLSTAFSDPMDYLKGVTIEGNLKPKVYSIVQFLHSKGVERISLMGFSWGGWVVANLLASDIAGAFVCGILPHPSINLEERVFGGSLPDLMARVTRPLLLLQTRGDPTEYASYINLLKSRFPTCDLADFSHMDHGFLLRGNLQSADVRAATIDALCTICNYLGHHFTVNMEDIVGQAAKSFPSFPTGFSQEGKDAGSSDRGQVAQELPGSVGEQIRQGYEHAKEGVSDVGQWVKEGAQNAWERTKEGIGLASERVQEGYDATKERAAEGYDAAKQRVGEGVEKTKEYAQEGYERVAEGYDATKQRVAEGYDATKQRVAEGYDATKQRVGEGVDAAKGYSQEAYEGGKQRVQGAREEVGREADVAKDRAHQSWEGAKERTAATTEQAGEAIRQTGEGVKTRSQQTREEAASAQRNK